MKSRLLPPPRDEEKSNGDRAKPTDTKRRRARAQSQPIAPVEHAALPLPPPPQPPPRQTLQVSSRPKGRLLMAAILLSCVTFLAISIWSNFLRDRAYGTVIGRVLAVSSPWNGHIQALYVRAGDTVKQGDVLAIVSDPELTASIDQLGDELRAAQADLDAQVAILAVEARHQKDDTQEILATYYGLQGELLTDKSQLDELTSKLERRHELADRHMVSKEEIDSLRFTKQGLLAKIENLQSAIATLQQRVAPRQEQATDQARLKPALAKIEQLQGEIRRLRRKQRLGILRAPTAGAVVQVPAHIGQHANPQQPLIELLEDGSLELVIYVSQQQTSAYEVGQTIHVVANPNPKQKQFPCQVVRIGATFERPALQIRGHYRPNETLLPIYLTPPANLPPESKLRFGSAIRVPTDWRWFNKSSS